MPFLVVSLLAAASASAACPRTSATHVRARSGKSVVYGLKRERVYEGAGGIYACHYPRGKPHRLNRQGVFGPTYLNGFRFAGHFVSFEEDPGSPAGDAAYNVVVRDLLSGRLVTDLFVSERRGDGDYADTVLLKRDGSVAWLAVTAEPDENDAHDLYEIHVADRDGVRLLDQDGAIAPDSLRLTADRRGIEWRHGQDLRTASFR